MQEMHFICNACSDQHSENHQMVLLIQRKHYSKEVLYLLRAAATVLTECLCHPGCLAVHLLKKLQEDFN